MPTVRENGFEGDIMKYVLDGMVFGYKLTRQEWTALCTIHGEDNLYDDLEWGTFGFRSNSITLLITVSIRTAQDPFTVFVLTIFPVLFQIPYPVSKLLSPGMRFAA